MELFLQARHPHYLSPTLSGTEETWILSPQGMDPFPSTPWAPYPQLLTKQQEQKQWQHL